jgi:hypothetical protein
MNKEDKFLGGSIALAAALVFASVVGLYYLDVARAFQRDFHAGAASKTTNDSNHVVMMTRQAEAQERIAEALEARCSTKTPSRKRSVSPSVSPRSSDTPSGGSLSMEDSEMAKVCSSPLSGPEELCSR